MQLRLDPGGWPSPNLEIAPNPWFNVQSTQNRINIFICVHDKTIQEVNTNFRKMHLEMFIALKKADYPTGRPRDISGYPTKILCILSVPGYQVCYALYGG